MDYQQLDLLNQLKCNPTGQNNWYTHTHTHTQHMTNRATDDLLSNMSKTIYRQIFVVTGDKKPNANLQTPQRIKYVNNSKTDWNEHTEKTFHRHKQQRKQKTNGKEI